jgi:hypothetical protein
MRFSTLLTLAFAATAIATPIVAGDFNSMVIRSLQEREIEARDPQDGKRDGKQYKYNSRSPKTLDSDSVNYVQRTRARDT